jgi:hypothetical protein
MAGMNDDLCRLLDEQGGVVTSAQALTLLTRRSLDTELKTGGLQRIWYGIYGRGDVDIRSRHAVWTWQPAQLSPYAWAPLPRRTGSIPRRLSTCTSLIPAAANCDPPMGWLCIGVMERR